MQGDGVECERSYGERERKREIVVLGEEDSWRIVMVVVVREIF